MTANPPNERELATVRDLLAALNYDYGENDDLGDIIEDYVLGYLTEDLGMGLFVDVSEGGEAEELSVYARLSFYTDDTVDMWVLQFPVTVSEFHRYLDELDLRVARMRIVLELPTTEEQTDEDDEVSIVEVVSRLFGVSEGEVIAELRENWRPVASDAMGMSSKPNRYLLWNDCLIVGLDDQYVRLFLPLRTGDDLHVGDVVAWFELGEGETIGITEFARALHNAVGVG
ncbi:hypothetical protein [Actinopolymorpha pittospori]